MISAHVRSAVGEVNSNDDVFKISTSFSSAWDNAVYGNVNMEKTSIRSL